MIRGQEANVHLEDGGVGLSFVGTDIAAIRPQSQQSGEPVNTRENTRHMRTDITQTYHRYMRKGGTKSKRQRGRASEREKARERKVDRQTDRETGSAKRHSQTDRARTQCVQVARRVRSTPG